jgi:mannosyltransferase
VFARGLGVPALGVDESITTVIARWPWERFDAAIHGQEVPLAPYYLAMRYWLQLGSAEWWLRLPSAVAMALAIGLLTWWVARQVSTGAAAATAGVALALPSVSRFAQEARPYGATVLLAVLCSMAWWRLLRVGGRWSWVWYAVSVLALGTNHALALTVVAAQLVAAAGQAVRGRPRPLLTTVTGAAVGVAALVPFLELIRTHAVGNLTHLSPTPANLWSLLVRSFSAEPREALSDRLGLLILALALIGALRLREPQVRGLLGYCWAWALVPLAVLGAAAPFRPTLVARYLLVAVPAWTILAAQGCLVLGLGVVALARRLGAPEDGPPLPVPRAVGAVMAVVVGLPVVALIAIGLPRQQLFRSPGGHPMGDVRPAVALLGSPGYRQLPVIVLPDAWYGVQPSAYDPDLPRRTVLTDGLRVADDGRLMFRNAPSSDVVPASPAAGGLAVLMPPAALGRIDDVVAPWVQDTGLVVDATTTLGGWTVVRLAPVA